MPGPQKGNPAAVAGLVLGLIGCVPFLTGVLAIVFSIVGIRKTRDPQVGGKGMAVAGLILGILSVVGWAMFGGGAYAFFVGTKEVRQTAKEFVSDIGQFKVNEAVALTNGATLAEIDPLVRVVVPLGKFKDTTVTSVSASYVNGVKKADVAGTADFEAGSVAFNLNLVKVGEKWKVGQAHFDPPAKK